MGEKERIGFKKRKKEKRCFSRVICNMAVYGSAARQFLLHYHRTVIFGEYLLTSSRLFIVVSRFRRKRLEEERHYLAVYSKAMGESRIGPQARPGSNPQAAASSSPRDGSAATPTSPRAAAVATTPRTKHASLERPRIAYSPMGRARTLRVPGPTGDYTHIWEVKEPIPVCTPKIPEAPRHQRTQLVELPPDVVHGTMAASRRQRHSNSTPTIDTPGPQGAESHPNEEPPRAESPRVPTFSTFKPDGNPLYERPRLKGQQSAGHSASPSQQRPQFIDTDTRKRPQNHYST